MADVKPPTDWIDDAWIEDAVTELRKLDPDEALATELTKLDTDDVTDG